MFLFAYLLTLQLRGFEYIKGIVVDPLPFDIERDLVTPTMKKKRAQMLKFYQVKQIEGLTVWNLVLLFWSGDCMIMCI